MFRAQFGASQNDTLMAIESYQRALEIDPDQPNVRNNLAMLLLGEPGGAGQAYVLAQQAVEARPNDANFRDTLAQAALAAKKPDAAEAAARKAIELDPGNLTWRNRLAEVLERVGKDDEAAEVRRQASVDASR